MNILALLIPVSLLLGGVGLVAFVWTLRTRQYEDLDGEAARVLLDEPKNGDLFSAKPEP